MSKRTINDVEYVADAMIIGHLRAAATNFEIAAKEFKRHHFEAKETELANFFGIVRQLLNRIDSDFCEFINKRVQEARLEYDKRNMGLTRKRRNNK